ncbi:hypothetical protein K402DRAFT_449252 [Aulographum hederae CBS 113979]|uniref:Uncharacterized protein n=1 Tax=Aulographum hederae CBS 113979 TaxID=1176131 RepID=A0A6G1GK45_9PEZI|nr:hypothetical protein K402DRAFT_449252 [Aulographum hederae CBS 113979]
MTRRIVYGIGLWITLGATAMTIASVVMPRWLRWEVPKSGIHYTYGLHERCSSLPGQEGCTSFPAYEDCHGDDRSFCSLWRSVGFLMSFAVILELACVVGFAVVLLGGKQQRDYGWKVLCGLLAVCGVVECIGMGIVLTQSFPQAGLFNNDTRFFAGWALDTSWILCTVSWTLLLATGTGILMSAIFLPEEGGYELIPQERLEHAAGETLGG